MYKGPSGMWSWLLHRVTGLGILLFLFVHIVDISMIGFGPRVYNESVLLFDSVIVRLLSLSLIAAVLFHSFNGVRIVLIDFWKKGARYQQTMFVVALVLAVVVFLPFAYVILIPKLGGVAMWFVQPFANLAHR